MKRILAGIVTYNPDICILNKNICAAYNQVTKIVIVDNASNNTKDIVDIVAQYANVELVKLSNNLGVAHALNVIGKCAYSEGFEWFLTLDQDSLLPTNAIRDYLKTFAQVKDERICILCPTIFDLNTNNTSSKQSNGYIDRCITSGSLIRTSVWNLLDGFDEWLFIDGVDHDFCDRSVARGYKVYSVESVVLKHRLGNGQMKVVFGKKVIVRNYSPMRHYYQARNSAYLARKNGTQSVCHVIAWSLKEALLVVVFEDKKASKVSSIARGLITGLHANVEKR